MYFINIASPALATFYIYTSKNHCPLQVLSFCNYCYIYFISFQLSVKFFIFIGNATFFSTTQIYIFWYSQSLWFFLSWSKLFVSTWPSLPEGSWALKISTCGSDQPTSQFPTWRVIDFSSSESYLLALPAWVGLPGAYAQAGIALTVSSF